MDSLVRLLVSIVPVIVAITLHEAAHGYAALALGDDTAKLQGRLSLNPLRHVDRVGTILLPGFLLLFAWITHTAPFLFGWAKPVPVNPFRFRDPRRGMMFVAAAGPLMNFFLAWLGALGFYAVPFLPPGSAELAEGVLFTFMLANLWLGLFNLLPIPPLDGGRIAVGLLPARLAAAWARTERAGFLVVILAMFVLPSALSEFGIRFDPVRDGLHFVLVPAIRLVLLAAGQQDLARGLDL